MNNFTIVNGDSIKPEMIRGMIELDKKVYEEKYWTNTEFMLKWFSKNHNIITMIYDEKNLAGYMCYLPIADESYFNIRKGEVFQDLTTPVEHIGTYKNGGTHKLYIFSIVLDPKYHGSNGLTCLLKGFYDTTKKAEENGVVFDKVLGDIVSPKGYKLAQTLGLSKLYGTAYGSIMCEGDYEGVVKGYEELHKKMNK